jgi:hypothetical protein
LKIGSYVKNLHATLPLKMEKKKNLKKKDSMMFINAPETLTKILYLYISLHDIIGKDRCSVTIEL